MNEKVRKFIIVAKWVVAVVNWVIASLELFPKFKDVSDGPVKDKEKGVK